MKIHFETNNNKCTDESICAISDGNEIGMIQFKQLEDGRIEVYRTIVDENVRAYQLGLPLFIRFTDFLQENKKKVIPTCPFIQQMFQYKPEFNHLLA